jgi:hypothetical protein
VSSFPLIIVGTAVWAAVQPYFRMVAEGIPFFYISAMIGKGLLAKISCDDKLYNILRFLQTFFLPYPPNYKMASY